MNSAVSAMSIMYVSCNSGLGHTSKPLTCGYSSTHSSGCAKSQVTVMEVQVPPGHMLTYILTAHARTRTCPVLLQLARQEPDELGGVDGVYLDRKGVKRRTGLSASAALSLAPGSPRSSLETNPVAKTDRP